MNLRHLFNPVRVMLSVFLTLALAFAASTRAIRKIQTAPSEEKLARARPKPQASPPGPETNSGGERELEKVIDQAIDASEIAAARWGVSVVSMRDGRVLYSRNADKLFTPASNMKIYTTAVALDLLGADHEWRTSVYADAEPDAAGAIAGDLVLYGRGAPDLVAQTRDNNDNSLAHLADDLYNRGVRRVRGNLIGDESYFRGEPLGDGWQWNDIQWYFGAEASALSINGNEVGVNILPPDKTGEPPLVSVSTSDGYVSVQNSLITVNRGGRLTVGINRDLSTNDVRVWGEFPLGSRGFGARLSVHNPALWAARLFVATLKARGIVVEGKTQHRDSRHPPSERFDPARSKELAFVLSSPLGEIARDTNKESINLYAELILRTLGRERRDMLSTPEPAGKERGDEEIGLTLIRFWLSRAGIPTDGLALHDGSGLSRLNLVTPESTSRLLVAVSKTAVGPAFRESLPTSGRDGTLGGRLKTIMDRVSAKTGSLTYDNSLSGYLTTTTGEVLAFSVLCNDQTSRRSSTQQIDRIISILAEFPPNKP
ncbi:MAG: D-alanyl-D-alanine carboxypeptidase/D-alanyl-D-alanine endopeptidase [Pyrinomonadaceae bacterium]